VNEYVLLALGVSLAAAVFSSNIARVSLLDAPALASLWFLAWAASTSSSRRRLFLVGAAGVAAAALSVVAPPRWIGVLRVGLLGQLAIALLPSWRSVPRSIRRSSLEAAVFAGIASAPILVIFVACVVGGQKGTLETLGGDLLEGGVTAIALAILPVLTTVLALDGRRTERPSPVLVSRILLAGTAGVLVVRLAWILSVASNPLEAFWCDGPFLINALKLSAHVPLYGPREALDSYTYSPLTDLLHHALLQPFGLELSLRASRVLVLLDQLGAAAILAWALWPSADALGSRRFARAMLVLILALVCFANLVAPAVHPDHPLLVCIAVAFALVIREEGWRRRAFWVALVFVTPLATSFKLSGIGIGVGLFAVFLFERRWRALVAVAASIVLAVGTVPLFGALGAYASYAIDVQSRGDFDLGKLSELLASPFGLAAACAGILTVLSRGTARRAGLLTGAIGVIALPAYLKVSGRDNNLTPVLVGAVVVALLAAAEDARSSGRRWNIALPWALAVTLVVAARPPSGALIGKPRAAALADFDAMTETIREDTRLGRRTMEVLHTTPWIAAGRRDVPGNRYASAAELFFAHLPEGGLLSNRIAEGKYDTIIAGGSQLAPAPGLLGEFNRDLLAALRARYVLAYPAGSRDPSRVAGAVIFRRVPSEPRE
jgi:hypothetical protein